LTELRALLLTYGAIGDADIERLRNHTKPEWLRLIKTNYFFSRSLPSRSNQTLTGLAALR
jgi:hypothetical protein